MHGPPLQARVAAANGTVLAACKLLALTNGDPGAHGNEQGQTKQRKMNWGKQTERGQELMRAVGMAGKEWTAGTQPAEQALQADTAGGFSARLRPQTNGHRWPASQQNNSCRRCWPAAVQVSGGECRGAGSHEGGCRLT